MSGGFFRGTSADQDTRFSNKQAKLMKSQKFAPELEHLVDTTKVKMDVIRPWIANRVTELLGFEDEVLINFIYGLLDGKDVNGKEVQISLTGFMEKNTGKFMKELWALLLSAQKNASGVPQQFLDAKEEETRRKKAEADKIANEIEKKKEKEIKELEQEKMKKMDGWIDNSKVTNSVSELISKHTVPMSSNAHFKADKGTEERSGRGRNRVSRSPRSAGHSPSSPRGSPTRSISKSVSNSGSNLDERHRSRTISGSPQPLRRSLSSERVYNSPERLTPRRRHSPPGSLSPSRRRSSYSRQRSTSVLRHRSPSPMRRRLRSPGRRRSLTPVRRRSSPRRSPLGWRRSRSPGRRRSRSPGRRRSRSPGRRRSRSPGRRRSRSPGRRRSRSPGRRRSRSPGRRRSRSPGRRRSRSPGRRRSPSPLRRRSPSPLRRRSPTPKRRRSPTYKVPSPVRRRHRRSPTPRHKSPSPVRRRSPIPAHGRSPSPFRRGSRSSNGWSSSSPIRRRSPSPVQRKSPRRQRSPVQSPRAIIRDKVEHDAETPRRPDSLSHRTSISMRSPQRVSKDQNNSRSKVPSLLASPVKSQSVSGSPARIRKNSSSEDGRSPSPYESHVRQTRKRLTSPPKPRQQKNHHESPETSVEDEEYAREGGDHKSNSLEKRSTHPSLVGKQRDSPMKVHAKEEYSSERLAGRRASETQDHSNNTELRKESQKIKSEKASGRVSHRKVLDQQKSPYKDSSLGERQQTSYSGDGYQADEKKNSHPKDRDHRSDALPKSLVKVGQKNQSGPFHSESEESDKHRSEGKERRKHKRPDRHEVASDEDSYDSQIDGRREAKRRKKEEKRQRKEERRRRREERRRRREDRRAEKLKGKSRDTVTPPSDFDKNRSDAYVSEGGHASRREPDSSESEEVESEQKKLEIELRNKALESLRAKKGIGH